MKGVKIITVLKQIASEILHLHNRVQNYRYIYATVRSIASKEVTFTSHYNDLWN